MVGANRFTEQEQGCRAEIVIQRIPAVEGQRDLLGRRGPEVAQNAPEISYDTAAINETGDTEDDDSDKAPVATRDIIIAVCISVVVGIIIGFIGSGIMKSKLTSVRYQSGAADYVVPDSFKLNDSRDVYLYSTVTKTERQTDKDR